MNHKFFISLLVFCLQFGSFSAFGLGWEDIFAEGKLFSRTQHKSPIYLEWTFSREKTAPGFYIHSYQKKEKIGFIKAILNESEGYIDFPQVQIEDPQIGSEVFNTLFGIFKASKQKLPSQVKSLRYICIPDEKENIGFAKDAGFIEKQMDLPHSAQIHLIKEIPQPEPIFQNPNTQPHVLKETSPLFPSPQRTLQSLPTSNLENAFKFGDIFRSRSHPYIYFKYDSGIDTTEVLEFAQIDNGFKIFRSQENDEIGYIVPNYTPNNGNICIGALWIKENLRRNGYGTQAIQILMSLLRNKKAFFPNAKYFSFYTTHENKAILKIAKKLQFSQEQNSNEISILALFAGLCFKKPFEENK